MHRVVADPRSTGAYYLSGTYDGSRPGVFYVGTQDVSAQAKFEMMTLSLHEGTVRNEDITDIFHFPACVSLFLNRLEILSSLEIFVFLSFLLF